MSLRNTLTILGIFGLATAACADHGSGTTPNGDRSGTETSSLALTVQVSGDVDADGVRYDITRVACQPGEVFEPLSESVEQPLLDLQLGSGFSGVAGDPVDPNAAHDFADYYTVLPAGCYDVAANPIDANGQLSADCAAARTLGVEVVDGQTTEVMLMIQCDGDATGGLDAVAALNREPTIVALTYAPSKFVTDCDEVTICASAIDPDGDPVSFEWAAQLTATTTEVDGDTTTACATFPAGMAGSHELSVAVYDMLDILDDGGAQVRIEDWLASEGYASESHDSLAFPLYVSDADCGPSVACPAGGGMVTDPAIFASVPAQDFEGGNLPNAAPFSLDGLTYGASGYLSTGWCIPGMDSNSPGCGGTNTYLTGDGTSSLTPDQGAAAIGFRWGTQGPSMTFTVNLVDGTSQTFTRNDVAPAGWGASGYFGYCAGNGPAIDSIDINSPDRGIDDVSCIGCQ